MLFFTINLHFVKSNQISAYRKPNLPLTRSIYLVFLSLQMQGRLKQTKIYHTFFLFVWKETTHKPLKVAAAKTLFSSAYVIGTTCFDEYFFILCDNWKTLLFMKVYLYSEIFLSVMLLLCLKPGFWKKSAFYVDLRNNNMMLIPKF